MVNEEALFDALTRGKLRGAGLDVLETPAPRPQATSCSSLENVIFSPHMAGVTQEAGQFFMAMNA